MKYGCDPSDVAQEVKEATVVQDIFPSEELFRLLEGKKMDVITSSEKIEYSYKMVEGISYVNGGIFILRELNYPTYLYESV